MSFSQVYHCYVLQPAYAHWVSSFMKPFQLQNRAHLVMLAKQGILSKEDASTLKDTMAYVDSLWIAPDILPEGVEDLFFMYEKALESRIGSLAGSLHIARSRNDMDATIFRMYVRQIIAKTIDQVLAFSCTTNQKISNSLKRLLVVYTHGQPAQISTLGHYLSSFLIELLEGLVSLTDSLSVVDQSPMGSAAITTSGFQVDRFLVAELLGFEIPVPNSYQAIVTSHWLVHPASALKLLAMDLSRLIADLSHKASCEVGMITFPDELVQVSSIMPQKRNPVILEHIRILSNQAASDFQGLIDLFTNVPYQDVNEVADAPLVDFARGCERFSRAVGLLDEVIAKMDIDDAQVDSIARRFGVTTTELADQLVRKTGIGFRLAHAITTAFVRSGYDRTVLKQRFEQETAKPWEISNQELDTILSPNTFVSVRIVEGGPASKGMESVIQKVDERTRSIATTLANHLDRWSKAESELNHTFQRL